MDTSDPSLPVAGSPALSVVRKSKHAPLRAAVLIGIHVLFLAHISHWLAAGRTLSPVEPSESMYTLELGRVNAGFIFFFLAIVSTLVFGRFFCGWGCHIVAVQDLCGWLMKKMGVRPRPFRSRLLLLVPAALAFYMFVWPAVRRLVFGIPATPFPGFTNGLVTADFWRTFAGPLFAALTLVSCGFAAVYFLGAKGFCTYGCPYGAVFGAADRLSVGRIVVSDACEGCGHCTATCTSNVLVHEEVRRFGMVVDPGCMKCTDCISVCPKGALSFGFAWPEWIKRRRHADGIPYVPASRAAKRYDLPLGQELALLAVCFGATLAFRGLYDGPPLLMAVGLGGVTAFLALKLWHLARRPSVRVQSLNLKLGGKLTGTGALFAGFAAAWILFTAHSGLVQWERAQGARAIEATEAPRADVLSGASAGRVYSVRHDLAADAAYRHYALADRLGLVGVVEVKLGLAWAYLLKDDVASAEKKIREAIALQPNVPEVRQNLVELFVARGRLADAVEALSGKVAVETARAGPRVRTAALAVNGGTPAAGASRGAAAPPASVSAESPAPSGDARGELSPPEAPSGPGLHRSPSAVDAGLVSPGRAGSETLPSELAADEFALGELLVQAERLGEAADHFARCVALAPSSSAARFNLGGSLRRLGRTQEAIAELEAAEKLAPRDADTRIELGLAYKEAGRRKEAAASLRKAIELAPDTPEAQQHLPGLIRELEQ